MYLSTEHLEPNEKKCHRAVDRMRVFKFTARRKARFFGEEEICYIMMRSTMGCTLRIKAQSKKIRALVEPEKVKEFNKQMTKSEMV